MWDGQDYGSNVETVLFPFFKLLKAWVKWSLRSSKCMGHARHSTAVLKAFGTLAEDACDGKPVPQPEGQGKE